MLQIEEPIPLVQPQTRICCSMNIDKLRQHSEPLHNNNNKLLRTPLVKQQIHGFVFL